MKLSEALAERSELSRKLLELRDRIVRNAKYQEGEKPAEDPASLLAQYLELSDECSALIVRINNTNNQLTLDNGMSMVQALAERDRLKNTHSLLKALATEATPKQDRYSKKEIKFVSAVSVAETQEQADDIAKAHRKLDSQIQQTNWSHDLIE